MSKSQLRRLPVLALEAAAVLLMARPACAADSVASEASGVVTKTEHAVKRGASAAEHGLITAASAAERGVKVAIGAADRGASAAAHGLSTAGSAVERTVKRLGVPTSQASTPR